MTRGKHNNQQQTLNNNNKQQKHIKSRDKDSQGPWPRASEHLYIPDILAVLATEHLDNLTHVMEV